MPPLKWQTNAHTSRRDPPPPHRTISRLSRLSLFPFFASLAAPFEVRLLVHWRVSPTIDESAAGGGAQLSSVGLYKLRLVDP
jgi:hypothetical protein